MERISGGFCLLPETGLSCSLNPPGLAWLTMLARLLPRPLFPEPRAERREAVVLPFSRPTSAAPQTDWPSRETRRGPSHGWLGRGMTVLDSLAKDGFGQVNLSLPVNAKGTQIRCGDEQDWRTKYPCIRMHGAAFEAEFYPASDQQF